MNTRTSNQPTTTVADYLLTRLSQAGVISVFGVPGDCNLAVLDAIAARPALAWQGMATEQGAGYAADSYARLRGLGAVVTTFGAGELSAINAVAGAYAESVPVVHIVGTPALATRNAGLALRHNLPGGDFGHFARMAAEVTAAQADLRPDTAPAEIDRVLRTAAHTSRPVYIAIPADVAGASVPAPRGRLPRAAAFVRDLAASGLPGAVLPAEPEDTMAPITGTRLTQRALWASLQRFLEPGDMVIADQGTAFYGAAELTLPGGAQLIGQPLWASTGWAAPAAVGATLGAPDRRLIVVAGDGALQQTATELGTLLALGLAPIIIVLNNNGYTTERKIGHPSAGYNDIPAWDWTALASALSPAIQPLAMQAASPRGFDKALRDAHRHAGRPIVIEAVLDRDDAPPLLTELSRRLAA